MELKILVCGLLEPSASLGSKVTFDNFRVEYHQSLFDAFNIRCSAVILGSDEEIQIVDWRSAERLAIRGLRVIFVHGLIHDVSPIGTLGEYGIAVFELLGLEPSNDQIREVFEKVMQIVASPYEGVKGALNYEEVVMAYSKGSPT